MSTQPPSPTAPATVARSYSTSDLPTAAVVKVIDGDTVGVHLDGQIVRLHFIGINTPKVVDPRRAIECFGRKASVKAHELLDGQPVAVEADRSQGDTDRYGRLLHYIWG